MKKLSLERETIAPLADADLDQVNGGTLTAVTRTVVPATKWVTRNVCPSVTIELATRYLCPGNGGGEHK